MKKQLIVSIIALVFSVLIFSFSVYAWFTQVDSNKLDSVSPDITGKKCTGTLYVLTNSGWIEVTEGMFNNFSNPGDFKYFKIIVDADKGKDVNITGFSFLNYETSVSNEVLVNTTNNYVYTLDHEENEIKICDLSNNKCTVNNHILYDYSNNTLNLDYYKLENVICIYDLNEIDISSISASSNSILEDLTPSKLNEKIVTNDLLEKGNNKTYYIAFEINENLMHEDGLDLSYLYMYQEFVLGNIVINVES